MKKLINSYLQDYQLTSQLTVSATQEYEERGYEGEQQRQYERRGRSAHHAALQQLQAFHHTGTGVRL